MAKLMWVIQDVETNKYLHKIVNQTHTGRHEYIQWFDDINMATVVGNEYGIRLATKGLKESVIAIRVVCEVRIAIGEDLKDE